MEYVEYAFPPSRSRMISLITVDVYIEVIGNNIETVVVSSVKVNPLNVYIINTVAKIKK